MRREYIRGANLEKHGFSIVADAIDTVTLASLLHAMKQEENLRDDANTGRMYARRNQFQTIPKIRDLAASRTVRALVEPSLGTDCFAVRALFFDKMPGANWKVPWHQDLSVAIAAQHEVEGFGGWSQKAGVLHAQAPISLLETMLTVRLHLDDCGLNNGPLRVLPGTHRSGRLDAAQIQALRSQVQEVTCPVERGGALLMRPLLLHASAAATLPCHRRVLHFEYANTLLPEGLQWHEAVHSNGR